MRGSGRLKAAFETRVLLDNTDAHVLVLLNALGADHGQQAWTTAKPIAKAQRPKPPSRT